MRFCFCSYLCLLRSTNLTVKGSKGIVSPSDQVYTSLPADSRKPAGPIDPSSE
jgi:inorganic pyrophosphatase